ncbi:MAG: HDOD domain-containing protein [Nitrospirae bacterium]|nr:HDOD domain-containing protein [Nitrospirota bacterium]
MNESLRLHVQKITKLPTIPVIAQAILKIVSNDLASADELEEIIRKDPPISAKVLSVANSAFFGTGTPTTDIKNAVVRIGFDNVKNIALGISLMTVLDDGKRNGIFDYMRIFEHSTVVGAAAKALARKLDSDIPEDVFINGMLHDIGFLIMNKYFPESYGRVLDMFKEKKSLLEAEEAVFGFTHADMGTWLVDKWNLPDIILDTTQYHHAPSKAKRNLNLAALAHVADFIATRSIFSATKEDPNYPFDKASLDILGISENGLKDLEAEIKSEIFI